MKTKLMVAVIGLAFVSGVGAVEGERSPAGDAVERAEMGRLAVDGIHNIQVGEDGDTVVCLVNTEEGKEEVLVLVSVEREGELYFSPVGTPDEGTGRFSPWVLRMEVGENG